MCRWPQSVKFEQLKEMLLITHTFFLYLGSFVLETFLVKLDGRFVYPKQVKKC